MLLQPAALGISAQGALSSVVSFFFFFFSGACMMPRVKTKIQPCYQGKDFFCEIVTLSFPCPVNSVLLSGQALWLDLSLLICDKWI